MTPKYAFLWITTFHRSSVSLHQNTLRNKRIAVRHASIQTYMTTSLFSSSSVDPPSSSSSILESQITLTSPKSATVKFFQSLGKKSSFRFENQMSIIEGHRIVIDVLSNPKTHTLMHTILVCEEALQHEQLGMKLLTLLDDMYHSTSPACDIILTTREVVEAACDTVTPQGVVGAIQLPHPFTSSMIRQESTRKRNSLYLILDGISDPGNLGTLLRSSLAVDIEAVVFLPDCCDYSNPKAVRSAMGASFFIPTCTVKSWDNCLELLKDCGVSSANVYAATMETNSSSLSSKSYYDIDWTGSATREPMALVIGREGRGLSDEVRQAVSRGTIGSVFVPMIDGIESLNAAVCGSVILFEHQRQHAQKR